MNTISAHVTSRALAETPRRSRHAPSSALRRDRGLPWVMQMLRLLLICVLLGLAGLGGTAAWGQSAGSKAFDHTRTGFSLSGQHKQQRCETCHQNGVFKGTPRDCASCHTSGARFARGNQVMPQNHVPTNRGCDTCHGTQGFTGAKFSHTGVKAGSCASCHNGINANGKTANHITTTASCDSCHRVGAAWASNVVFDHAGVAAGTCASCHNGSKATGQSARHVPNAQVSGMGTACDSCHRSGFTSWLPAKVHANFAISSACATCHTGSYAPAVGKPATPVHANAGACEGCHSSTSVWALGARPDHGVFNSSTNCANCHNGSTAPAQSANHIPTSQNCIVCHSATAASWKPTAWNHTQLPVAGQCASCHNGAYPPADGPVAKHIAYKSVSAAATANCDACHKAGYASWNPGAFHRNFSVTSGCASCHNAGAVGATQKPATAIHSGVTVCETCHTNTSAWASGGRPDHSAYSASTACATCHNGSTAPGKSNTHIPTSANCSTCHTATATSWKPTLWNHTQQAVAGQCASCHSGGFAPADGPIAQHIPYTSVPAAAAANCDACHKAGYASWNPGTFHRNFSVNSACATCHNNGSYGATQKPGTAVHSGVTVCETCHTSTTAWALAGGRPDHSSYTASTSCASCHNGSNAPGKSSNHIPTTANCISCHNPTATAWKPSTWNHTQQAVSGQCATCHTGSFAPADGPASNHIAYKNVTAAAGASCDACHKAGYVSWNPGTFHRNFSVNSGCAGCHNAGAQGATQKPNTAVHNGVSVCETCHTNTSAWGSIGRPDHSAYTSSTTCSNCHNGSTAPGKTTTHIPTTANCVACHTATAASWKPALWNHTQQSVSGQCASCHSGSYPPADGPVANHIAYKSVPSAASLNCDGCHKAGYASWNPGVFHRNASVSSGCATCHNAGALGATQKPGTAIHTGVTVCETCHTTTSSWAASGKPDHASFTAATSCATCHNGNTAGGKSAAHIPTTANCIACHNPTGSWKPALWNHTQQAVSGQCATCHSGSYPPADGPVANHIAYKNVPASAAFNCDACHKAGYASWNPGTFHRNASVSTGCASCHNAGALGATQKPNTAVHVGVTACETCHTSTSVWGGISRPDHSTFTLATNCSNCHNGSTAPGKPGTHIPTTTNCVSCHTATAATWKPTLWNHTQQVVTGQCATCHNGSYPPADGLAANHIAYKSVPAAAAFNCDGCHKAGYASWNPGTFHRNASVSTGCASCHNAGALGATQKPNTAVHVGVTACETCHTNTSAWTAIGRPDHGTFTLATTCTNCHNGSTAPGKPGTHIPTTANCINCHTATAATWKPTLWNHTQQVVTGQCATCHNGSYAPADGVVSNHIPYKSVAAAGAMNCDGCHKAGYASWSPGYFHRNVSVSTGCATCHMSPTYLGPTQTKPNTATHNGVTSCEGCHKSTTTWSGATFAHSATNAVGTGTCDTCHNGSTAKGKSATHVPITAVTAKCDSCHKSQLSFATAVTMNHSVVTLQSCKGCHNGSYLGEGAQGALAKPANHIPESQLLNGAAMDCNACHTSTSAFSTMKMNHNSSMGNGAGWCKACHATGTTYLGSMEKKSLTHQSKATTVTDCSMSGCHRPLGTRGAAYTRWD
ncbi:MAG: hypothetical protein RIQ60_3131 [Pseudomonadota bacterium]|jgi:hypothetical protein